MRYLPTMASSVRAMVGPPLAAELVVRPAGKGGYSEVSPPAAVPANVPQSAGEQEPD